MKKFLLMSLMCLGLLGCQTQTVTVHIVNEQIADPGFGGANIVQGHILEKMGYGLCAGANTGEVVEVQFKIIKSDSGPSGNVWFFKDDTNSQKKAAAKLK